MSAAQTWLIRTIRALLYQPEVYPYHPVIRVAQVQALDCKDQLHFLRTGLGRRLLRPVKPDTGLQIQQLALPHQRQRVRPAHREPPLGYRMVSSALDKKSFSIDSCPILACRAVTSAGDGAALRLPCSNTSGACSISTFFQAAIWLGCTPY